MNTVRDTRRANLLLLEQVMGSLQAVADLVGKSHSQISQLKSANAHSTTKMPRTMGDRVAADFANALGVPPGWMDYPRSPDEVAAAVAALKMPGVTMPTTSGQPAIEGQESLIAHGLSLVPHRVPPTISWESLMDTRVELPDEFAAAVPDDALQPGAPRGTKFIFSRAEAPAPGRAVLVRDRAGQTYLRRFRQGVGTSWSAQATNDAYASLESERDGLMVLAVATWRFGGDV